YREASVIKPTGESGYSEEKASYMNSPIVAPMKFIGGRYKENRSDTAFIAYEDFDMPPVTLVEFSRRKNIIQTRVAGRDGTVKEYIGMDDYQVTFRGMMVNREENLPPELQIRQFAALTEVPDKIDIEGDFFEYLGIFSLVVESWTLPQLEGHPAVQPFTLTCIQDKPFEINEDENPNL
ncbi:MAG: DUF6046 domain-containing protein, partial [Saprospiraceae bacterium]